MCVRVGVCTCRCVCGCESVWVNGCVYECVSYYAGVRKVSIVSECVCVCVYVCLPFNPASFLLLCWPQQIVGIFDGSCSLHDHHLTNGCNV